MTRLEEWGIYIMEILKVENLSKNFKGIRALRDVSFNVEEGEKLVVIGPNGAGKTTLINILNGQLLPSSGHIYFGRDISTMPVHRRTHLGMSRSFQLNRLFPDFSVFDNVLLGCHSTCASCFQMFRPITAYRREFAKVQELLELMELDEKKDVLIKNLPYGEQRKLEITLSLALEPRLLLLDEPSAGLTAAESTHIISIISKLRSDITAIIVAHDMDLVFGVADRILVLHYGQVLAEGTPEEIKASPSVREIYLGIEENAEDAGAS